VRLPPLPAATACRHSVDRTSQLAARGWCGAPSSAGQRARARPGREPVLDRRALVRMAVRAAHRVDHERLAHGADEAARRGFVHAGSVSGLRVIWPRESGLPNAAVRASRT
jgi:hypothetical protein